VTSLQPFSISKETYFFFFTVLDIDRTRGIV